jgi:hypothetical protein
MRVSEGACRTGLLYGLKQMRSLRFRFAGTRWTWPMAASKVSRAKNGMPSVHPLTSSELRALRRLQREQETGRHTFMSERGAIMSAVGVRQTMVGLGKAAKMPFPVHPHMLRQACGFKLANDGQDTRALQHYPGHKNPAYRPTRAIACAAPVPASGVLRQNGSRTFGRIRSRGKSAAIEYRPDGDLKRLPLVPDDDSKPKSTQSTPVSRPVPQSAGAKREDQRDNPIINDNH